MGGLEAARCDDPRGERETEEKREFLRWELLPTQDD